MSLAIETDDVVAVLLADGWHAVTGKTFDLDSYEYLHDDVLIHGGGNSGVCATGFAFMTTEFDGSRAKLRGPLTSVLAVRCK